MIIQKLKIYFFFLVLISCISIAWNQEKHSSTLSIFDGPHYFYHGDSVKINYYNHGKKESYFKSSLDTVVFRGYLEDSLVTYSIPNHFDPQANIYTNVDKIFVISDIHGQYDIFTQLLYKNGIIDGNNQWIWEDGHLVILGDVFDRGDEVHEILWLIYNLENQAHEVGGKVHFILGNHEVMVLQNDLRYVKEKYFVISDTLDIELSELYGKGSFWGRWLRSKNFLAQINSCLFVHGGISTELLKKYQSINEINRKMRLNIDINREEIKENVELSGLFRSNGPIWYRGFFEPDSQPDVSESDLTNILNHFNVEKIIVGHTTIDSIQSFYDHRIINIDGGIKYGERGEGLLIIKNNFYAVDVRGKSRLLYTL